MIDTQFVIHKLNISTCVQIVCIVRQSDTMNSMKNSEETGHGLEDLGIPGQVYLRDALTSCTDPLKAIEGFQVSNLGNIIDIIDTHLFI